MSSVKVSCHLVIGATISESGFLRGAPSVRVSKGKPSTAANEVAVRLNIELPMSLFKKPQLEASILVPEEQHPYTITPDIEENISNAIRKATGMNIVLCVESLPEPNTEEHP